MLGAVRKNFLLVTLLSVVTVAAADRPVKIGPHPQANLPPLEMPTVDPTLLPRSA
jgi:hypothetical protein